MFAIALFVIIATYALKHYIQFKKNLNAAKASGIKYIIVPFFVVDRVFQVCCIFIIPIVRKLPRKWTEPWFDLCLDWSWKRRYEPFQSIGSDTFITVAPVRNTLYTADADVISQITTRRSDFPKAIEVYEMLQIYGDNVVTVEGQLWRHHRKITSPPFSEHNNHVVWTETLDQCQAMVNGWLGENQDISRPISTVADDCMRLSLYVISRAGFGVHLQWPQRTEGDTDRSPQGPNDRDVSQSETKGDHTMSYTNAISGVLNNIVTLIVTPRFLLSECSRLDLFVH